MTKLPRYSIKVDASAAGVQVGMAADPAGEYVRVDELQFFVTQFFGRQPMDVPSSFPEAKAETAPSSKQSVTRKVRSQRTGKPVTLWTADDVQFLEKNYGVLSYRQIADHLGRTLKAVEQKVFKLGMNERPAKPASTVSEPAPVAEMPAATEPAEVFDRSNPFIRQIPESAKPGSGRQVSWS